ncbi:MULTISPECIES: hypothetical protein [unclassified Imperialibacter]|uniref:hypothetical protein n=1 Tax=unclassified Imperialibacter TaxID=2629706 RepID=UPI001869EF8A|nr:MULTISPECIES: hypothetical protein [unclassified Imperialibacter]
MNRVAFILLLVLLAYGLDSIRLESPWHLLLRDHLLDFGKEVQRGADYYEE